MSKNDGKGVIGLCICMAVAVILVGCSAFGAYASIAWDWGPEYPLTWLIGPIMFSFTALIASFLGLVAASAACRRLGWNFRVRWFVLPLVYSIVTLAAITFLGWWLLEYGWAWWLLIVIYIILVNCYWAVRKWWWVAQAMTYKPRMIIVIMPLHLLELFEGGSDQHEEEE